MVQTFTFEKIDLDAQGFTQRGASLEDVELATALFNAHARHFLGVEKFRAKDAATEWVLPGFDPGEDIRLVFAPDGRLVGYGELWDLTEPYVRKSLWCRAHPDFQEAGLYQILIDWAEARALQQVGRAPQGARVVLQAMTLLLDKPSQIAFEDMDFYSIRNYLRMVISLDQEPPMPRWPQGIRVRTMGDGEERLVIQAVYEAFKDHWGFIEEPFEAYYQRWMHFRVRNDEFDPSLWYLAMDGDQVAGVSLCWPKVDDDPDMGWVGTLGVRRPWRRQGLGLALLYHSFGNLYARGKRRIGLGVDATSLTGATRLYEKAGMRSDPTRQFVLYEKELRPGKNLTTQQVR